MQRFLGRFACTICCLAAIWPRPASAEEVGRTFLTIGQLYGRTSLPIEEINANASLPFRLSARYSMRPEAFPCLQPLPDTPGRLPEVVSALVGYRYNELAALARKGLIEPLDDLFDEAGIDPKEFLPPNAYGAVHFDGHIWALPHRMQFVLASFDESLLDSDGLDPAIDSWQAFCLATEAAAGLGSGPQQGFDRGQVPVYEITALLLHLFEREGIQPDEIGAFQEVMGRLATGGALEGPAWARKRAVTLETFHTLGPGRRVVVLPPSNALTGPVGAEEATRVGFMEAFALRINSDEKREGARQFFRWLMRTQTQMALMDASRWDVPKQSRAFSNCHVPLYEPVLEFAAFDEWCNEYPVYAEFARALREVDLTEATNSLDVETADRTYRELCSHVWETDEPNDLIGAMGGFVSMAQAAGQRPAPGVNKPEDSATSATAETEAARGASLALMRQGDMLAHEGDYRQAAAAWLEAWIQSPECGEDLHVRLFEAWMKEGEWLAPLLVGGESLNDAALDPLKRRILNRLEPGREPTALDEGIGRIGSVLAAGDLGSICDTLEMVLAKAMADEVPVQEKTDFGLAVFLLGGSRDIGFPWPDRLTFAQENRFHAIRRKALDMGMDSFDALTLDMQAFYALRIAERRMDGVQVRQAVDVLADMWRNPNIAKRWRERLLDRYATILADECARPEDAADAYTGYCSWHKDAPKVFLKRADSLYTRARMPMRR